MRRFKKRRGIPVEAEQFSGGVSTFEGFPISTVLTGMGTEYVIHVYSPKETFIRSIHRGDWLVYYSHNQRWNVLHDEYFSREYTEITDPLNYLEEL